MAFILQGWGIAQLQGAPVTLSFAYIGPFGVMQFNWWPYQGSCLRVARAGTSVSQVFILYNFIKTFHFTKWLYFFCLCLCTWMSVYPAACSSVCPPTHLSIHSFTPASVCPSSHPLIHLVESVKILSIYKRSEYSVSWNIPGNTKSVIPVLIYKFTWHNILNYWISETIRKEHNFLETHVPTVPVSYLLCHVYFKFPFPLSLSLLL